MPSASVIISDATDSAGYAGVTLRRTNLYASPDDSQAPADFFWGGVVLSGYSRVDAAGEWLTIVYAGQRYYVKASDVSLNDASAGGSYTGATPAPHRPLRVPRRLAGPGGLLLGRRRPFRLLPLGRRRRVADHRVRGAALLREGLRRVAQTTRPRAAPTRA